jgi:iron complex transport system ATP-binding protein
MEIMEMLKSLTNDGVTILAAMHDLNLSVKYCDKLIVLDKGKLVACGKPEDIVTQKLIEDVYGVKAIIQKNPEVGLIIIPLSTSNKVDTFNKKNKARNIRSNKTPTRWGSVKT